jgi:hypothetical protein
MPASDDPLRNKVVQWVKLADDDVLVAEQISHIGTQFGMPNASLSSVHMNACRWAVDGRLD